MKFYTSVLPYKGRLLVRGINHDGSHKKFKVNYKPSLFTPVQKETGYKTLDGRNVAKIQHESMYEARKWIDEYKDVTNFEYFGNTRFQYPYIADEFPGKVDWDLKQIRLITIDIECESENGFPDVDKAEEPLICITVKDHARKSIIVFGCGNFVNDRDDVKYFKCSTERDLVQKFTKFWTAYNPDIVTGWNVKFFDIPYLMNRFRYLMGDEYLNQFSPWGIVSQNSARITAKGFNKEQNYYDILGISVLDYLDLYRKHTFVRQESYKLDYIGQVELGEQKTENPYDTFKEFYQNDYQLFVEYNIQDVELVDKLEDKMQLIALHLTMAYEAKVNYQDVFGQVRMWDTIIFNHLKSNNVIKMCGQGWSKDLNISESKAIIDAKLKIADITQHSIIKSEKIVKKETSKGITQSYELNADNTLNEATIVGYKIVSKKVMKEKNGWRTMVLLEYKLS